MSQTTLVENRKTIVDWHSSWPVGDVRINLFLLLFLHLSPEAKHFSVVGLDFPFTSLLLFVEDPSIPSPPFPRPFHPRPWHPSSLLRRQYEPYGPRGRSWGCFVSTVLPSERVQVDGLTPSSTTSTLLSLKNIDRHTDHTVTEGRWLCVRPSLILDSIGPSQFENLTRTLLEVKHRTLQGRRQREQETDSLRRTKRKRREKKNRRGVRAVDETVFSGLTYYIE